MENSIHLEVGLGVSPLLDILICFGIICAIGFFLWNRGRISTSLKR